jgi:hypothetical protein
MKVQSVSRTNTGSSSAIVINTNTNPCNIGFGVVVTSGTPTYTVQHTFDDPAVQHGLTIQQYLVKQQIRTETMHSQ